LKQNWSFRIRIRMTEDGSQKGSLLTSDFRLLFSDSEHESSAKRVSGGCLGAERR
jgi:hypothetical protein